MSNPVFHFEIPVADMERAIEFYEAVFEFSLERAAVDGYEMAFFPRDNTAPGASGALARGDIYNPSQDGSLIYFDVPDIDAILDRAQKIGSTVLYQKTDLGEAGFVAELNDSEGNRIGLTQAA